MTSAELDAYYVKEYGPYSEWSNMLGLLEGLANEGPNKEERRKFVLDCYWYVEASYRMDDACDLIRDVLRGKFDWPISREQAKECLRLRYLFVMFDRVYFRIEDPCKDQEGYKQFCLAHPLWQRMERQAKKTLDTFRLKKSS